MLIYNKPLSRGQTLLSGHSPVSQGWPLDGGSTVFWILGFREIHPGTIKRLVVVEPNILTIIIRTTGGHRGGGEEEG